MSPKKRQKIPKVAPVRQDPPPPMTVAEVEESFMQYVDYQIAHRTAGITKWKTDRIDAVMDDPGHLRSNLEWMDGFVEDVCELEVWTAIKIALTPPTKATLETVFEYELDSTLDKARYPSHSSSYMTNFVNLNRTAAQAEVVKTMRAWVKMWKEAKEREATVDPEGHLCQRPEDNE